ncbi:unnamed protein product [Arctia plantaginis]|uniref:Swi5-dependent recombination DNA repair protein 1 homolog n=1 Tax=Arctia plantaginis TaxID=874455 RepID=A0A8S0ZHX3_ARCPL|nr:unnamed protein product [Arctia plantaginis]
MKNISSLRSNDTNSPKTPGGISKSLLTPCRRLGLSRSWRKSGPSPFISPLASVSADVEEKKSASRKRKECLSDENIQLTDNNTENEISSENIEHTPSRNVEAPRRKKSKTLLVAINEPEEQELSSKVCKDDQSILETQAADGHTVEPEVVSTPVCTKPKKSKKHVSPLKSSTNELKINPKSDEQLDSPDVPVKEHTEEATYAIKEKIPNDLSKECVVVIQRKMFKNSESNVKNSKLIKEENPFDKLDSDSDEAPLIKIQKQNSIKSNEKVIKDEDDDFVDENKTSIVKLHKVKNAKSPKNKQKTTKPVKTKSSNTTIEIKPLQSCLDDDDDDDFDNKKTILIKKTYDKVSKPTKAKSTGSITQRDIDKLKERIEAKKKLLLAQSLTPDTEELRSLIKKWQKGCQDALMELLDLMRNKFSDNTTMDYSEMLRTLKIPPSLVGYDSENDCFISPDDTSIILGQFKDI